jgi:hypothetical protein
MDIQTHVLQPLDQMRLLFYGSTTLQYCDHSKQLLSKKVAAQFAILCGIRNIRSVWKQLQHKSLLLSVGKKVIGIKIKLSGSIRHNLPPYPLVADIIPQLEE